MEPFNFSLPTGVVFGPGSVLRLPQAVAGLGSRALLVTYPDVMRATGILGMVTDLLDEAGVVVVVDEGVEPNPRSEYVDRLARVARDEGCSFVVGLGGGSAMDAAKAIAFAAANGTSVLDYLPGGSNPWAVGVRDALPIVTIATTAGTGSEVTRIAVITDTQRHYKPGVVHPSLYPTVSIVDPNLMLGVPAEVTATTGVDVLFHALEAYLSRGANLFSDLFGQEAIRLTVTNLETAFHDGSDLEARTNMAWASTLAGVAFDNANVVAIHAIGQCIGGTPTLFMAGPWRRWDPHTWATHIRAIRLVTPGSLDCSGGRGKVSPRPSWPSSRQLGSRISSRKSVSISRHPVSASRKT